MKRFSLICLGLGMSVLLGFAQSTKPATVLHHRTKAKPVPSITGAAPRHAITATTPQPRVKTGSVDAQLNSLERDTAKSAGAQSKNQSNKTAHAEAPKSNDTTAGRKAMNFRYQAPSGVSKGNQASQPSSGNKSIQRRVSPGAR